MNERQIKALADRGRFPGKALHRTVEETHISWVILTDAFAFKIKKPLKLSFLDFSTLARRRKYCHKEVSLNRRFSGIYLGVLPVKYQDGIWRLIKGAGKIRDYAVKMKRMDSSKRMDLMITAGEVSNQNIIDLAMVVASFHVRARVMEDPPDPAFFRKAFNDINVIKPFIGKTLPGQYSAILSRSLSWSDSFLRAHASRLKERVALGYRRDLHGDLHSGNIFLYKVPVPFDCIEFNDTYRQTDMIDEVAFLCMDLEAQGCSPWAEVFVKAYKKRVPSCISLAEDKKIFNYFKCYRANVRAKVHALAAAQEKDAASRQKHLKAIRSYLLLMREYMKIDRGRRARTDPGMSLP